MKNTHKKKNNSNNKTKKNNVKKCMEIFAEKRIKYWSNDNDKQIKQLDNKKKITDEEHKLLFELKKKRKEEIKTLTKAYRLHNCNINCKNTILEPGPPDQIPKSMYKILGNDKELIKMFNNDRKTIFKNKTNVLVDNFYENTPKKIKNKLIKEGAISQCIATF